jgi:hypothetical protein
MKFFLFLFVLLAIVYGAFVLSSYGVLVSSQTVQGTLKDTLKCNYFTGLGFSEKEYWYSTSDILGRSLCPRTIYFGEDHAQTQ